MNDLRTRLIIIFTICLLEFTICITSNAQGFPDKYYIENGDTLIPSNNGIGGNVFLGYGIQNGNISNYFSNPFFIGFNIDVIKSKILIQFDNYIGFGKVTETLTFPDNLKWKKNKAAIYFMGGLNFGYPLIENKTIKIVPLAGIGANLLSSKFLSDSENSKNEPFLPYYKFGCYIDIKSLAFLGERATSAKSSYNCLRLSFGVNSALGSPKYSEYYKGQMIYLSIGMGGRATFYKKKTSVNSQLP